MHDEPLTVDPSAEWRLLLRCARSRMDAAQPREVAELARGNIDWAVLLHTARAQGVLPMLHRSLSACCPEIVPGHIREQLRAHFSANARRNLHLTGQVLELLGELDARGIPAIAYKGPTLAAAFYGNLALRSFVDLDLLIRPQDVPRARAFLLSREFQSDFVVDGRREQAYIRSSYDYEFHRAEDRLVVELHWRLVPDYFSFAPDLDRWRERLEPIQLGGREVRTLCPEDLLLYLCVHGTKHHWMRLGWICDIAEVVRARPGIGWDRVIDEANATGSRRMLFLGLLLAADLLGVQLPPETRREISADRKVTALAADVRERLFKGGLPPDGWGDALFHLRARERMRDRLRYCALFILAPTAGDLRLVDLPRWLGSIYYLLRPLRLAWKYGTKGLKSLGQRSAS